MRAVVSGTVVLVVALRTVVWRAIDSGGGGVGGYRVGISGVEV